MSNGNEIVDRMREATGGETDAALANFLSVPRGTVASWRRRDTVPVEYLMKVCDLCAVTVDWLLTGQGDKTRARSDQIDLDILAIAYELSISPKVLCILESRRGTNSEQVSDIERNVYLIAGYYSTAADLYAQLVRAGLTRYNALLAVRRHYRLAEDFKFMMPQHPDFNPVDWTPGPLSFQDE